MIFDVDHHCLLKQKVPGPGQTAQAGIIPNGRKESQAIMTARNIVWRIYTLRVGQAGMIYPAVKSVRLCVKHHLYQGTDGEFVI